MRGWLLARLTGLVWRWCLHTQRKGCPDCWLSGTEFPGPPVFWLAQLRSGSFLSGIVQLLMSQHEPTVVEIVSVITDYKTSHISWLPRSPSRVTLMELSVANSYLPFLCRRPLLATFCSSVHALTIAHQDSRIHAPFVMFNFTLMSHKCPVGVTSPIQAVMLAPAVIRRHLW